MSFFVFQLLRKHRPKVLQEVLLTLHDKKSLSVETLLTLLGVNCKHCVVASPVCRHSLGSLAIFLIHEHMLKPFAGLEIKKNH